MYKIEKNQVIFPLYEKNLCIFFMHFKWKKVKNCTEIWNRKRWDPCLSMDKIIIQDFQSVSPWIDFDTYFPLSPSCICIHSLIRFGFFFFLLLFNSIFFHMHKYRGYAVAWFMYISYKNSSSNRKINQKNLN